MANSDFDDFVNSVNNPGGHKTSPEEDATSKFNRRLELLAELESIAAANDENRRHLQNLLKDFEPYIHHFKGTFSGEDLRLEIGSTPSPRAEEIIESTGRIAMREKCRTPVMAFHYFQSNAYKDRNPDVNRMAVYHDDGKFLFHKQTWSRPWKFHSGDKHSGPSASPDFFGQKDWRDNRRGYPYETGFYARQYPNAQEALKELKEILQYSIRAKRDTWEASVRKFLGQSLAIGGITLSGIFNEDMGERRELQLTASTAQAETAPVTQHNPTFEI